MGTSCNFSSSTPRPSPSPTRLRLVGLGLGLGVLERSRPSTPPPAVVLIPEFLDTHEVGHEPADIQVKHIMETLQKANIAPAKMVCFSRDNPTVMQKTARLLTEAVKAANCPKLVDLPCLLHPTHTSFKEAVKVMDKSIA